MHKIMAEKNIIEWVRTLILGVFLFSILGTGTELLLLEHTEDAWMWTPLVLMGSSVVLMLVYGISKNAWVIKLFRGLMLLFLISGFLGIWFHFKGNMEFEQEMYPSMKGWELFTETMQGATPALAPGTMIQLGLIGLIYTLKHPVLTQKTLADTTF